MPRSEAQQRQVPKSERRLASSTDTPINLDAHLQAAAEIVLGKPILAVAQKHDLGRNQTRRIGEICGMAIEEFREIARQKAQQAIALLDERMPGDIAALKPMEAQIAYGIRMDKYRDITGGTAPTSVHVMNIQVNGSSRREALAALTGVRQSFTEPTNGVSTARALAVIAQ